MYRTATGIAITKFKPGRIIFGASWLEATISITALGAYTESKYGNLFIFGVDLKNGLYSK